jgi:nucleoside 2-deoxyribosyltransferase
MIELKAPQRIGLNPDVKKIFLAGSIEMGKAEKWQDRLAKQLADKDVVLFNPRRDDWDSSWVQDPTPGTKFHEQVSWELEHIQRSDLVVFYFDPNTQSPITLLELGYVIGSGKQALVCCPDGYFRKGNVVISSELGRIPVLNSFEELLAQLRDYIG